MKDLSIHIMCSPGVFRDLLSSAVSRVGSTLKSQVSLDEALEDVAENDCIIIHIPNSDKNTLAQLRAIRDEYPNAAVTILSSPGTEPLLHSQTDYWANAIIPDNKPLDLVIETLSVVSRGYSVMDTKLMKSAQIIAPVMDSQLSLDEIEADTSDLSKREVTVLKEIRVGRSNKEIARVLDISDSTVKVHMRSIFRKIGVRNRTEAAIWVTSRYNGMGSTLLPN